MLRLVALVSLLSFTALADDPKPVPPLNPALVEVPRSENPTVVPIQVYDPSAANFNPLDLAKVASAGAQAKNWGAVIIALLIGFVFGVRWFAKKTAWTWLAWARTQAGGWGLNLGGSTLSGLLTLVLAGPVTVSSVLSSVVASVITSLAAAGALTAKQDLVEKIKGAGAEAAAKVPDAAAGVEVFKKGPVP